MGIVQVTLDTRLGDRPPEERRALAQELERRLLALFLPPPDELPSAPPVAPPPPVPPVAVEDAPARPASVAPPTSPAAASPFARLLDARLKELAPLLRERADLRARIVELAEERPAAADEPEASRGELQSLDLLQRRTAKLERALHEARAALAYVSGLEHVDQGLASIYRTVQGLSEADPTRAKKREALEEVFRANLALQKSG
jgi:hypothetical protein